MLAVMQHMRGGRETNRAPGAMQPCLIPRLRGLKIRQIGVVNALSYRHYGTLASRLKVSPHNYYLVSEKRGFFLLIVSLLVVLSI